MTNPKMTLEQEIAAAVAIYRIGLERLVDIATRSDELEPHLAVLRALRDHRDRENGVLGAVSGAIGTIRISLEEVDHEEIDHVLELLDTAQGYAEDSVGERIDRVVEILTPVLTCEGCSKCTPDVKVMDDPYTSAIDPEGEDHPQMTLCQSCATARFEES